MRRAWKTAPIMTAHPLREPSKLSHQRLVFMQRRNATLAKRAVFLDTALKKHGLAKGGSVR